MSIFESVPPQELSPQEGPQLLLPSLLALAAEDFRVLKASKSVAELISPTEAVNSAYRQIATQMGTTA